MATLTHVVSAHTSDVNWCAFSTKYLATCSGDKTIRLWNIDDFTEVSHSPLRGHSYYVHCVCFSPFETLLASCSTDGKIIVWNPKTGDKQAVFEHKSKAIVRVCLFSPDSKYLASGGTDNKVYLWQMSSKQCVRVFEGHDNVVVSCTFTPDSSCLVSGSTDGDIRVWDAQFGQNRCLFYTDSDVHDLGVTCIVCSPTFGAADPVVAASSPSKKHFLMATCGADNLVKLWDLNILPVCGIRLRCALEGHTATVMACAFSLDGKILVSGAGDKTLILWDPLHGGKLHTIEGHSRYVTSCAFSMDGQYLASGSNDRTCRIWQLHFNKSTGQGLSQGGKTIIQDVKGQQPTQQENKVPPVKQLHDWSVKDVCDWLRELGLEQHVMQFERNEIDGQELSCLTKDSLMNDLGVTALGHRNKILRGIESIKEQCELVTHIQTTVSQTPQYTADALLDVGIPDEFLCPITREVMRDPVIASDGYTYERSSIEAWIINGKNTSPMTNNPLTGTSVTPNRMLKMLIERSQHHL
ncbi:WD repeat, SAM and U-box domain-containing protein 1-like isoform X2 [Glandiceps talaboti]